jgi:ribosome-associated heat shock protein Hsp15
LAKRKDKAVGAQPAASAPNGRETIRLDKWLFYARFFKTRVLASTVISKGRVRINGQRQSKPGHAIGPGRVLAPGTRRGPASEAQALYLDLDPPRSEDPASNAADPASPLE